jgi:hypothetical protein
MNVLKSGNIVGWLAFRKWHFFEVIKQKCLWWMARFIARPNNNVPRGMRHHFVPMQTGPANFIDFAVDETNAVGQLDAFHKAEHIHPNFDGHQNDFSKIKGKNLITLFIGSFASFLPFRSFCFLLSHSFLLFLPLALHDDPPPLSCQHPFVCPSSNAAAAAVAVGVVVVGHVW